MKKKGFTLIEVLMVVFILGLLVTVGSNLLFSVMKGASKTEFEKEAKQSGDYALGVMERMVRNASEIENCSSSSLEIKNRDGYITQFSCVIEDGTAKIASSSGGLSSALTGKNVTLNQTSPGSCSGNSLTFTCDLTNVPPVVTFSFTLSQLALPTGTRVEERGQSSFQTTVGLRNY